jgi:outer membrane protein insertion porin family
VRQKTGVVFVPSKLDKDVERLDDFYGKDGYLDTRVRLNRKPNVTTGAIDVEYVIAEGEKFSVESIVIEGNTKTKSTVLLRELVLGPGDVFSTVLMKISQLRLENTRFFESVNVNHQETNIPGRRNMRIAVREGRTGNLTFGAGFSSLERATVQFRHLQPPLILPGRRPEVPSAHAARIALQRGGSLLRGAVAVPAPAGAGLLGFPDQFGI